MVQRQNQFFDLENHQARVYIYHTLTISARFQKWELSNTCYDQYWVVLSFQRKNLWVRFSEYETTLVMSYDHTHSCHIHFGFSRTYAALPLNCYSGIFLWSPFTSIQQLRNDWYRSTSAFLVVTCNNGKKAGNGSVSVPLESSSTLTYKLGMIVAQCIQSNSLLLVTWVWRGHMSFVLALWEWKPWDARNVRFSGWPNVMNFALASCWLFCSTFRC